MTTSSEQDAGPPVVERERGTTELRTELLVALALQHVAPPPRPLAVVPPPVIPTAFLRMDRQKTTSGTDKTIV